MPKCSGFDFVLLIVQHGLYVLESCLVWSINLWRLSVIVIWIAPAFPYSPNYSGISLTWGFAFVDASQILILYSWISCCIILILFFCLAFSFKFFIVLSQAQRLSSACVLFANEPIKGILVCPDICDLRPFCFGYFLEFLSFCVCQPSVLVCPLIFS